MMSTVCAPCPLCSETIPWARAYRILDSSVWWCPTCHLKYDDDVIIEDRETAVVG